MASEDETLTGGSTDMTRHYTAQHGNYEISSDPARIDVDAVVQFLRASYWAPERSRATIERSIQTSIVFGVYEGARQIGFARVISDKADFAWLCDVYVDAAVRARGLGKWLMKTVLAHPDLQDIERWLLATRDAHGLYQQFGFVTLTEPNRWMERSSSQVQEKIAQRY